MRPSILTLLSVSCLALSHGMTLSIHEIDSQLQTLSTSTSIDSHSLPTVSALSSSIQSSARVQLHRKAAKAAVAQQSQPQSADESDPSQQQQQQQQQAADGGEGGAEQQDDGSQQQQQQQQPEDGSDGSDGSGGQSVGRFKRFTQGIRQAHDALRHKIGKGADHVGSAALKAHQFTKAVVQKTGQGFSEGGKALWGASNVVTRDAHDAAKSFVHGARNVAVIGLTDGALATKAGLMKARNITHQLGKDSYNAAKLVGQDIVGKNFKIRMPKFLGGCMHLSKKKRAACLAEQQQQQQQQQGAQEEQGEEQQEEQQPQQEAEEPQAAKYDSADADDADLEEADDEFAGVDQADEFQYEDAPDALQFDDATIDEADAEDESDVDFDEYDY